MTLTKKLGTVIILATLLTAAGVGVAVFLFTKQEITNVVALEQEMTTEAVMQTIDRALFQAREDIQAVAALSEVIEEAQSHSAGHEDSIAHEKALDILRQFSLFTGPWDVLEVANSSGKTLISTVPDDEGEELGEDPSEESAFQSALAGKIFVSDLAISDDTGKPTVIFAAPVKDKDLFQEPVIGVAIGQISWPVIQEVLGAVAHDTRLYNSKGILIGTSRLDERGDILVQSNSLHPVFRAGLQGTGSLESSESDNRGSATLSSYVSQKGYREYLGSDWVLIAEAPIKTIFGQAQNGAVKVAAISVGLILFFFALFIFFFLRAVVTPLRRLRLVVEGISKGNIGKRAKVTSKDEIGQLTQGFNVMLDRLTVEEGMRKQIIEALPGALFLTDVKGSIEHINPSATALLGYSSEELLGKSIGILFPASLSTDESVPTAFQKIGLNKLTEQSIMKNRAVYLSTKEHQKIPVMLFGRLIKTKTGDRVVLIALDRRKEQNYVRERLIALMPILEKVSTGDYNARFNVTEEDEFSDFLIGLNLLFEDIKEVAEEQASLTKNVTLHNRELELKTLVLNDTKEALKATFDQLEEDRAQIEASDTKLKQKLSELERFNKLTVDREIKMIELKKEIARLKGGPVKEDTDEEPPNPQK